VDVSIWCCLWAEVILSSDVWTACVSLVTCDELLSLARHWSSLVVKIGCYIFYTDIRRYKCLAFNIQKTLTYTRTYTRILYFLSFIFHIKWVVAE